MAEHSPCPTPERAIYGFVLYLSTYVLFGFYVIWALLPDELLHKIGIDYLPQRLWVFLGPFLFILGVSMALMLFLLIKNWRVTPEFDSLSNFTDKHQRICECGETTTDVPCSRETLLPLGDIPVSEVNRRLFLNQDANNFFH